MNKELEKIKTAWESRPAAGQASSADEKGLPRDGTSLSQHDNNVVALADKYVKAHPELFVKFQDLPIEKCVEAVEIFRAANMLDDWWLVETWILHHFEFQEIGGPVQAKVRTAGTVG